jgi:hypothetical protein
MEEWDVSDGFLQLDDYAKRFDNSENIGVPVYRRFHDRVLQCISFLTFVMLDGGKEK